ncbi:WD-repeat protein [Cryptococcus bacillisporus CA1873]|uniref:ASTRA-associated protein 1 n=1 Tax=Cryptococcus bacillisporus CA1873 TaxID=1296111 RepID=A0ABR5B478_CRYGA|nr:WD-repeat protein [Cryptococcus bacillisporus CA1873]|eukprot:KIR58390.1 WD-repeat protein [Cryptococcus gattii CA1873]
MSSPAPVPFHTIRTHSSPLASLHFSASPPNSHLYAGDQDGWISVLDLKVRRVIAFWKGHEGGVLGLGEWQGGLISHGRDNVIHFYEPLKRPYIPIPTSSTPDPKSYQPSIKRSLPTNALNFCRFSLVAIPAHTVTSVDKKQKEAVMAVPSLVDSELVDIYHIPSLKRLHASINFSSKPPPQTPTNVDLPGTSRTGLIMSLHLFHPPPTSFCADGEERSLGLVIAYEDGRVELLSAPLSSLDTPYDAKMTASTSTSKGMSTNPWKLRWCGKGHNEAIMASAVDSLGRRGWSVSADHRLVRYEFDLVWQRKCKKDDENVMKPYATKQIGNSSIGVSADGKVVAVGGWDGKIRLFSAATSKPLGTLVSHRETVHALAFAHLAFSPSQPITLADNETSSAETETATTETTTEYPESTVDLEDGDDSDADNDVDSIPPRERWLASGGKDGKVALWGLMDFSATG